MSVVYEPRALFHGETSYPPIGDHDHDTNDDNVLAEIHNYNPGNSTLLSSPEPHGLELATPQPQRLPTPTEDAEPSASPPHRIKPIPKPDREVRRNLDGKYECSWPGCSEDVKIFNRKCEWSKHMDKHDRPYKCPAVGCEKLPGFTYSGGLLRHEREVHGKHGGPKNPLNCPHINCKRHSGKGFSRQENLNEHLRRVHTNSNGGAVNGINGGTNGSLASGGEDEPEDNVSLGGTSEKMGEKRKFAADEDDIRDEVKRLRSENNSLKEQVKAHGVQAAEMMRQMTALQSTVNQLTTANLNVAPHSSADAGSDAPLLDDPVSHAVVSHNAVGHSF